MSGAHEMVLRVQAAQATRSGWFGVPFVWGETDCVFLAASHLRQAGLDPKLSRGGAYRSARGALAALKKAGFASLGAALDDLGLERIAPAQALVSDILSGDADHPLGALGIYLGNGAMIGWAAGHPTACNLRALEMRAAWRVPHG